MIKPKLMYIGRQGPPVFAIRLFGALATFLAAVALLAALGVVWVLVWALSA